MNIKLNICLFALSISLICHSVLASSSSLVELKKANSALKVKLMAGDRFFADDYKKAMIKIYKTNKDQSNATKVNDYLVTWLAAFAMVAQHLDEDLGPDDVPTLNVSVPQVEGQPTVSSIAGMSPYSIKNRVIREAYIKAIEANNKKAVIAWFQLSLGRATRDWFHFPFRAFLIRYYDQTSIAACKNLLEQIEQSIPKTKVKQQLQNFVKGLWKHGRRIPDFITFKDCKPAKVH
jgi:hypothetical protein